MMANDMGMAGLLPTIKCSNCNLDVEISAMGEHVCTSAREPSLPPELESWSKPLERPLNTSLKPGRTGPPPRIDPSAANRPFLRLDVLTPSSSTGSRSVSPSPAPKSPYHPGPPPRSYTSPLPMAPPSPDMLNLDCAFPPFPTSGRSTPASERKSVRQNPPSPRHPLSSRGTSPAPPPISPEKDASATISNGMHRRGPSMESRSSYRTSASSSRYGESISRPSTANSMRRPSMGGGSRRNVMDEVPPMPIGPLKSFRPDSQSSMTESVIASSPPKPKKSYSGLDFGLADDPESYDDGRAAPVNPASFPRSQTMPVNYGTDDNIGVSRESLLRRPSQLSTTTIPARLNTDSRVGIMEGKKNGDGNLTVSHFTRGLGLDNNAYHAAGASTSSTESSPSDIDSGSSISSPPSDIGRKPSDLSQINAMLADLQLNQGSPPNDEKPSITRTSELEPPRLTDPWLRGPDSPTDPSLEQGGFSLRTDKAASPKSPLRTKTPNLDPLPRPITASGQKRRCRGCNEPITGKSVSSADGRLTGRYHKACFVCHTCRAPFQTADFYVLDDYPYCAQHYHELNGSICKTCNRGIEGQYLESLERSGRGAGDRQKFHPDCLTCRTCRIVLRGDYFEWNGSVYCERDARRAAAMTPPPGVRRRPTMPSSPLARPPGYPSGPPPGSRGPPRMGMGLLSPGGPGMGPPNGSMGLAPGPRRFPERRTTKLMMI